MESEFDEDIEKTLNLGRIKTSPFSVAKMYPENLKVDAETLGTMPVNQVSVECLFSGIKFIVNVNRPTMKEDLVESLMMFLRASWE